MKLNKFLTRLAAVGLCAAATAQAGLVTVTNDITGAQTWYATNEYLLNTVVYVHSNAVLTIEPGTVVKGGTNAANLVARDGLPNLVSALWVARGGKLYATGTVAKPIIFTMEGDDVNDPNDIPPTLTAQWGGVVIMGQATINSAQNAAGNVATPKYDLYEGVTTAGTNNAHAFGGNDDEDNSGALRYVSIRHTGNVFAPAKELNALTMGGVGRGTVIEYVEVFAGSDDGFEWWGGTVNTKHLVAAFMEDDDFDTDQGYRGTNQFWFGIKPTWQGSTDSRGIESDGDLNQSLFGEALPFSQWSVHNLTLIGRGTNDVGFGGGSAWNARDEAAPNVINAVVVGFNKGMLLDGDGLYHWTNTTVRASALNNVWEVTTNSANANSLFVFNTVGFSNTVEAALLGGISYTNNGGLDPRPQVGSPALANVLPGAPVTTSYRGAFSATDNWANGWTALAMLGYLNTNAVVLPPPSSPTLGSSYSSGTLTVSSSSQVGYSYQLQGTGALTPPVTWTNIGSALPGTGSTLGFPVPTGATNGFFRVLAQ